jgi:hypothetical protein
VVGLTLCTKTEIHDFQLALVQCDTTFPLQLIGVARSQNDILRLDIPMQVVECMNRGKTLQYCLDYACDFFLTKQRLLKLCATLGFQPFFDDPFQLFTTQILHLDHDIIIGFKQLL